MRVHGHELEVMGMVPEVPCTADCKEMRHWDVTYAPPHKRLPEVWEQWEEQHQPWVVVLDVVPAPEVGPPDPNYMAMHGVSIEQVRHYTPWRIQFIFQDQLKRAATVN